MVGSPADWYVEHIWPDMIPYEMLLDVSISSKIKIKQHLILFRLYPPELSYNILGTVVVLMHDGDLYSMHHYVIKFVSDLPQVGGFLRIKLIATI